MAKINYYLLMIFLSLQVLGIHAANFTRHELLQNLTDTSKYNPNYPPGYNAGILSEVTVQLIIVDLTSISEQNMEYRVMVNLRMKWKDKRLDFSELASFSSLDLSGNEVKLIWTPDLIIRNERKTDQHMFLKNEEVAYIYPDGVVLFRIRLSMTNFCHMDLNHYPFDVQQCEIGIESYVFTADMLQLKWSMDAVQFQTLGLPNYEVDVGGYTSGNSSNGNNPLIDGTYSFLQVILEFRRTPGAYRSSYFFPYPIFFIIALSSFAFKDQISSRITLCTAGITASVLQWIGIYTRLPPVWYLTYLDYWIFSHVVLIGLILVYHSLWYMCLHQAHREQDQFEEMLRENLENIVQSKNSTKKKSCLSRGFEEILIKCCCDQQEINDEKEAKTKVGDIHDDFRDHFNDESKKELTSDKRYKIVSKSKRKKYFEGYVGRLGQTKFSKAIKKNSLDFSVFLLIIVVYSLMLVLFVYWVEISKIYLVYLLFDIFPGGGFIFLNVPRLIVYCKTRCCKGSSKAKSGGNPGTVKEGKDSNGLEE